MLKYLAILAVLFGLTVYVSIQDERATQQAAQKAAALHKTAVPTKPDEQHPQENIEDTERNLPSWYSFFRWPNGTTTWAILLTLMAIAEQTGQTRKAAEAALQQASHLIASERAWIVLSSVNKESMGSTPMYWWRIKNVGSTPAKIIETQAVCRVDMAFSQFPEEPQYPRPVELNGRLLAPGDFMDFHTFWSDVNGGLHRDSSLENPGMTQITYHLVGYGYVKYLTILDPDIHESRFCDDCVYSVGPHTERDAEKYFFRPYLEPPYSYSKST